MPPQSEYRTLREFLVAHITTGDQETTHTKIRGGKSSIAGKYHIPENKLDKFYNLYYTSVISKNETEHLTEKQLTNEGPILVDLDFRYDMTVKKRLYQQDHVDAIVGEYADKLQEIFAFKMVISFRSIFLRNPR